MYAIMKEAKIVSKEYPKRKLAEIALVKKYGLNSIAHVVEVERYIKGKS